MVGEGYRRLDRPKRRRARRAIDAGEKVAGGRASSRSTRKPPGQARELGAADAPAPRKRSTGVARPRGPYPQTPAEIEALVKKEGRSRLSGLYTCMLLHDGKLSRAEILDRRRKLYPDLNPTMSDVRWCDAKLRKNGPYWKA